MTIANDLMFTVVALLVVLLVGIAIGVAVGGYRTRRALLRSGQLQADGQDDTEAAADGGADVPALRPKRAAIILNPVKPASKRFRAEAFAVCRQEGWADPLIIETAEDDPGVAMAREAVAAEVDVVIAAGGDGTVRCVAEGLVTARLAPGQVLPAMGIVPLGTGNLLARNLEIVLDRPHWALRIALWGGNSPTDVATAKLSRGQDAHRHVFMVMAGMGYDATVMATTNADLKSKVGWLAYVDAGTRALAGNRIKVDVSFDDGSVQARRVRSVLGGNAGKLTAGIELLPGAKLDDGLLDVLFVSPKNLAQWAGVFASIMGKHTHNGIHTEIVKCKKAVIETYDESIDVQADGDPLGSTDYLELEIEPGALVMRTPTAELRRQIRMEDWRIL